MRWAQQVYSLHNKDSQHKRSDRANQAIQPGNAWSRHNSRQTFNSAIRRAHTLHTSWGSFGHLLPCSPDLLHKHSPKWRDRGLVRLAQAHAKLMNHRPGLLLHNGCPGFCWAHHSVQIGLSGILPHHAKMRLHAFPWVVLGVCRLKMLLQWWSCTVHHCRTLEGAHDTLTHEPVESPCDPLAMAIIECVGYFILYIPHQYTKVFERGGCSEGRNSLINHIPLMAE